MAEVTDHYDGTVSLTDDHQAVELIRDGDMLRRVICCCDCGLVHLMSINPETRMAYFVSEHGPVAEDLRAKAIAAGQDFSVLRRLAESEAARLKAEGERDEAQRIIGLQQAALDVWKAAHPHEAVPKPHRESMCLEPTLRADIVRLRKDLDRKDHEFAEQKANAEAAEARLRAVIEAADEVLALTTRIEFRAGDYETVEAYRRIRDAQPASPEPEASKQVGHEFKSHPVLGSLLCMTCGLPWSQHGGRDGE